MRVSVVDAPQVLASPGLVGLLDPADLTVATEGYAEPAFYAAALTAASRRPTVAVLAFSEYQVLPAALVADSLGLPGPGMHAALISRSKGYQRAVFGAQRLPQPAYQVADSPDDAARWAAGRYPVVVKPLAASGSLGVAVCDDEEAVRAHIATLGPEAETVVEDYVAGREVSVEACVWRGEIVFLNITDKVTTAPPYCIELEHHVPARIGEEQAGVESLAQSVVEALRMGNGIVHLELKLGPGGPVIVEVAVRTPGDHIMDLVEAATGVSLFDATVATALDLRPATDRTREEAAAVWFPTAPPGRIIDVGGTDMVRKLETVERFELDLAPGDAVPVLRSSEDRLGYVLLRGQDRGAVERQLAEAKRLLTIETSP
jgi:biotin carboxylase